MSRYISLLLLSQAILVIIWYNYLSNAPVASPVSTDHGGEKPSIEASDRIKPDDNGADKRVYVPDSISLSGSSSSSPSSPSSSSSSSVEPNQVMKVYAFQERCHGAWKWMPRNAFERCPGAEEKEEQQRRCVFVDTPGTSDAVLFTIHMLFPGCRKPKTPWPSRHNPRQKWIMHSRESQRLKIAAGLYKSFNATVSVMPSADFTAPLGEVRKRARPIKRAPIVEEEWQGKKNVAWLVSNCNTLGGREEYVKELSKHIDVTIYGTCGKKKCGDSECNDLQRRYKFYLAFENSVCAAYVTEKLYRTLASDLIPIVYGMYDYKHYLPDKSFIDVRDFQSPKHLADYLHKVSKDKTLYESYFTWKEEYEAIEYDYDTHLTNAACGICDYLHRTKNDAPKTVDLEPLMNTDSYCIPKKHFWKIIGLNRN